jgi:26S proteasome regulatory subunit N8
MTPPATTVSTKSTGDGEISNENGLSTDKNQSITISPLNKIEKVVVHPLVLLSVVDHFNRMGKIGNSQRVVGLLLGSLKNKILDISNSFACKISLKIFSFLIFLSLILFSTIR